MQDISDELTQQESTLGFVPTLGYLHPGHLSLIEEANEYSDVVVVSIFVNPTQFGPNEDYEEYPRNLSRDKELCQEYGVDYVFRPTTEEMYPSEQLAFVNVEKLTDHLCGACREGHFRGVTTVVAKLFNIIKPDVAVFGQKDGQQGIVIRRMIEDLNFDINLKIAPTVREESGLAVSSRNRYLSEREKEIAPVLYRSLQEAKETILNGERDAQKVSQSIKNKINKYDEFDIDYVSIVDTEHLQPVEEIRGEVMIALAAYLGDARLIDNVIVNINS